MPRYSSPRRQIHENNERKKRPSENEDIELRKVKTTKTITLQFPTHMLPVLKCRAKAMGLPLSAYFTKLLREELKRRGYLKH